MNEFDEAESDTEAVKAAKAFLRAKMAAPVFHSVLPSQLVTMAAPGLAL